MKEKIKLQLNDNITIDCVIVYVLSEQGGICGPDEYNYQNIYLCYGQNRLFTVLHDKYRMMSQFGENDFIVDEDEQYYMGDIIVDYCVIPEYDKLLKH